MKLVAPKLSYIEKTSFEECLKKMKFQDVHIDQNIQQRTIIQDLTFDGCLFENIDFTKVSLKYLDLIDVTFDKCDLSNQNFDHQYLNRVQFKNCKLTGTSFIETNLKDVLFDHCQGRYSNLSSSQLLNVMFDHCDLQEASFYDANFKKIQFCVGISDKTIGECVEKTIWNTLSGKHSFNSFINVVIIFCCQAGCR